MCGPSFLRSSPPTFGIESGRSVTGGQDEQTRPSGDHDRILCGPDIGSGLESGLGDGLGCVAAGIGRSEDHQRDRTYDCASNDSWRQRPNPAGQHVRDSASHVRQRYGGAADSRAAVAAGLNKTVTFGGKTSLTIPAGGSVRSDAVAFRVDAQQDLAVSLFVNGANVAPSQHGNAVVTSYLTANDAGEQTSSQDGKAFTGKTTAMFWLKSIDVRSASPATAIVAFGDSITDGTCSTLDAHDRWEDVLAQRLALMGPFSRSVVNEGIGGNTVTGAHLVPRADSPPGLERLERDVLSHSGVSHVVLFMGTNDIRRDVGADELMTGMREISTRLKAKGIKVIGATIIPRHNVAPVPDNTGWNDAKTKIRNQVNDWIRTKAGFDGVLDFDKIVRSPANPDLIHAPYNCGDGIHPSPIGYFQMGKSVDLGLFLRRKEK